MIDLSKLDDVFLILTVVCKHLLALIKEVCTVVKK